MTDESRTENPEKEGSFVSKIVDAAKSTGEKIGDVVEDVIEKAEEMIEDVAERVGLKDKHDDDDTDVVLADKVDDVADNVEASTKTVAYQADTTADVVADKSQATADVVADKAEAAADVVTEKADAAAEAVADTAEAAADVVDNTSHAAADAVGDAAEVVAEKTEAATEAVADTTEAAMEKADSVGEAVKSAVKATVEKVAEVAGKAVDAVSDTAETVTDKLQTAGEEVAQEAGAVFEPSSDEDEDDDSPSRLAELEPGMELEGRVTSTALYGVFVDVGVGRDGLVHISEMSEERIESPTDLVQIGDTVKVRVKSVDPEARRISLSMRPPRSERRRRRPEINQERLTTLEAGELVEGTVNGIAPFGVFVDIGVGKDGLVHISELSDARVERPEDAVSIGDTHTFRVLEVDTEGQRISLSLRRAQEGYQERRPTRRREVNLEAVAPGMILDGSVSGIAPFGAFIDLNVGRDGLVHISELSEGRVGKVEDVVAVGDQVKVRVLEVDPDSKRISLSMRLEVPVGPVSTSGSSRLDRDWSNPAKRDDSQPAPQRGGGDGPRRNNRRDRNDRSNREPETYTVMSEAEEEFSGNATLDDLLMKWGSEYATPRTAGEEDEKSDNSREDIINRTLGDDDEE